MEFSYIKVVHKKYTHKDGKVYGPYLYSTRRANGKVVTTYHGAPSMSRLKILSIFLGVLVLLILSYLAYTSYYRSATTGMVSLDVDLVYKEGEPLDGDLRFRLKEGEFIPQNSRVLVSYGSQSKTFVLSDLVRDTPTSGSYYAEGTSLSGEGEGYGVKGTKIIYPTISFTLKVTKSSSGGSSDSAPVLPSDTSSVPSEEPLPADTSVSEPASSSSSSESAPSEPSPSTDSSSSSDSGGSVLSGNAVSEDSYEVHGTVSKGSDFTFSLGEGESVSLITDSVLIESASLSANTLSLSTNNGEVLVSTKYYISEEGYGASFLGDYGLTLDVPLSSLGLLAELGTIRVDLVHTDVTLATLTKQVDVVSVNTTQAAPALLSPSALTLTNSIPAQRTTVGTPITLDLSSYFAGAESYSVSASELDASIEGSILTLSPAVGFTGSKRIIVTAYAGEAFLESNPFLLLVSSGAVSITTERQKIVAGEPVKWKKTISVASPEAMTIALPPEAGDVVVKEAATGEVIESSVPSAGTLSGNVVIELNIDKPSLLKAWFKRMLRSFGVTGRAIEETAGSVEVTLPEEANEYIIEYTTPAPTLEEIPGENGQKSITVSATDGLGYKNVIASTTLPNERRLKDASRIRLYWTSPDTEQGSLSESLKEVDEIPEQEVVEGEQSTDVLPADVAGNAVSADNTGLETPVDEVTKEEVLDTLPVSDVIPEKVSVPFDAYDLDEDGNIDYIEWVVPHLSSQYYEVVIGYALQLDGSQNLINDFTSEVSNLDTWLTSGITNDQFIQIYTPEVLNRNGILSIYPSYDNSSGSYSIKVYTAGSNYIGGTPVWTGVVPPNNYTNISLATMLDSDMQDFYLYIYNGPGDPTFDVDHLTTWNRALDYAPTATSVAPINTTATAAASVTFSAIIQDDYALLNYTFVLQNSSGVINTTSVALNGTSNRTQVIIALPRTGVYTWYWVATDDLNQVGYSPTYQLTYDLTAPTLNFVSPTPSNGSTIDSTSIPVNVSSTDGVLHYVLTDFNRDLRLWLTMEDHNASGDPTDLSSWSNNGSLRYSRSAAQPVQGVYGNATFFNETNNLKSAISVPDSPSLSLNNSNQISVFAWIYRSGETSFANLDNNLTSVINEIVAKNDFTGAATNGWELYVGNPSPGDLGVIYRNNGVNVLNIINWHSILLGQWYFVGFTYNGTTTSIYQNGLEAIGYSGGSRISIPWGEASAPLVIGARNFKSTTSNLNFFNGTIDDVMLFNRSLTASEVRSLYNATVTQYYNNFTGLGYGNYNVTAHAVDAAGNRNSLIRTATLSNADTTAPVVNLQAPSNGSAVTSASVSFNATFSDNIALSNGTFYLWNSSNATINTTTSSLSGTSGSINLSVTLPYTGTFLWNYQARDSSNNPAFNSTNWTLTYSIPDTTIPLISYGTGTESNNSYIARTNIYVNVSVTEANEQAIVFTLFNTTALINQTIFGSGVRTINWTGLANGAYYFNVSVNDTAGNMNRTATRTVTVDTGVPFLTYISPLNRTYNSTSVWLNVSVNDTYSFGASTYYVNGDTETINVYTNPVLLSGLVQGTNYIDFTASDAAGNLNSSRMTFSVDTIYPQISISSPLNQTYASLPNTLTYSATDTNVQACWFTTDSGITNFTRVCGTPVEGLTPSFGSNTWRVYVNDSAGNVNSSSVTFTVDTVPPAINITYPRNTTYGTFITEVIYTVSDSSGLSSCWWSRDGGVSNTTITCGTNVSDYMANSAYTILIGANDSVNNRNATYVTFVSDMIIPTISSYSPLNATYYRSGNVTLNISASDSLSGIANYTFALSNTTQQINLTTTVSSSLNLTSLADGIYYFNITARDNVNLIAVTSMRTFTIDTTTPLISITSPLNQTYNSNVTVLNYTVSDTNIQSCWYTLNNGVANISVTCGTNVTGITSSEGTNTWTVYTNDTVGNTNSSSVTFSVLSIAPTVAFVTPTPDNATYLNVSTFTANVTGNTSGASLDIGTVVLDGTNYTMTCAGATPYVCNYTFSGVSAGVHTYYVWVGLGGLGNQTETRTITIDVQKPLIAFGVGTENSGSVAFGGNIYVNLSLTESNLANTTFSIYNATDLVNRITTDANVSYNVTGLADGLYTYQVNATDLANNRNGTGVNSLRLVSSCLSQCSEGVACIINASCMLYSGLCTGGICDFVNLTVSNATIYTLYDLNNAGNSLILNITSNASSAARFVKNSSIVFSGKNGTVYGVGSLGGLAGNVSVYVAGLFNRSQSNWFGRGGYSTLAGTGGNGGFLQLYYHGLIGAAFASSSFVEGSSISSSSGTAGSSTLVKDLVCPLDPDLTNNGIIASNDYGLIETSYGNITGDTTFNVSYDITCDGVLDVRDIAQIGFQFGRR